MRLSLVLTPLLALLAVQTAHAQTTVTLQPTTPSSVVSKQQPTKVTLRFYPPSTVKRVTYSTLYVLVMLAKYAVNCYLLLCPFMLLVKIQDHLIHKNKVLEWAVNRFDPLHKGLDQELKEFGWLFPWASHFSEIQGGTIEAINTAITKNSQSVIGICILLMVGINFLFDQVMFKLARALKVEALKREAKERSGEESSHCP